MEKRLLDWEVVDSKKKTAAKQQKRILKQKEIQEQQKKDRELLQKKLKEKIRVHTVTPDVTVFSSLARDDKVEKREERKSVEVIDPKQQQKEKKEKKVKKQAKKLSVKQAGELISNNALVSEIRSWELRFPENQDIQLKCLAEHLEKSYKNAVDWSQKVLEEKKFSRRAEMPACYMPEETRATVRNFYAKKPLNEKTAFFWFLLQTINNLIESKSEYSGLGLKVSLQLLLQAEPQVLWDNLENIREKYVNRGKGRLQSQFIPLFVWMLCQTYSSRPLATLCVWYELLLPALTGSSKKDEVLRDAILSFVEHVVENKETFYEKVKQIYVDEQKRLENDLVTGYERLVMYVYSSSSEVPERLKSIFPELSEISKTPLTRSALFATFLAHAATENRNFRDSVLLALVQCLRGDTSSAFSTWTDIYSKYIAQSNNLMLYILLNWEEISPQVNSKELLVVVNTVLKNNKLLLNGTYIPPSRKTGRGRHEKKKPVVVTDEDRQDINMCTITCKALRKKITRSTKFGFMMGAMSKLLPVVAIGSAVYLFYLHCCDFDVCREITPFCIKTSF